MTGPSAVPWELVTAFRAATERLLRPGSPFELATESVNGRSMSVFARRPRSLAEVLDRSAGYGDAEYLVYEDGPRITFAEHRRLVAGVAASLRDRFGVGRGDRVALAAANGPAWVLVAGACVELGAVLVALNSWWTADELRAALELSTPCLVVADAPRRARLAAHGGRSPAVPVLAAEEVADGLGDHRAAPSPGPASGAVGEDDPAVVMFTSGTTGRPRAVVLSHRSLVAFVQLSAFIGARQHLLTGAGASARPPVRLAVFPLFHISGFGTLLTALEFGIKTVWPAGAFDAGRVLALTRDEGITAWNGASTHIVRLLDHPDIGTVDPAQIEQVGVGGSATTPGLRARIEARFPHLVGTLGSGYGMTESGGLVSYATRAMLRAAPDCVGDPLPTVEVRVADAAGRARADGELGTIWVRSPLLLSGLLDGTGVSTPVREDGWMPTEDYGRVEHGLLFMATRQRDLIIRGGENVYPVEVEDCLDRHPDVAESAVYPLDDAEFGQTVHAAVHLRPGAAATPAELRRHCAEHLAYYKVPATVRLLPEPLPRNATGKPLKHVLIERARDAVAVDG